MPATGDGIILPIDIEVRDDGSAEKVLSKLKKDIADLKATSEKASLKTGGFTPDRKSVNSAAMSKLMGQTKGLENLHKKVSEMVSEGVGQDALQPYIETINNTISSINELISKNAELTKSLNEVKQISAAVSPMEKPAPQETDAGWMNVTSVKELDTYLGSVEQKILSVKQLIESFPPGENTILGSKKEEIEETISSIEKLSAKIADISSELAKSEEEAKLATSLAAGSRKREGIFQDATQEQIDAYQEAASTARLFHSELQSESAATARKVTRDIDEIIAKLNQLSEEYSKSIPKRRASNVPPLGGADTTENNEAAKRAAEEAVDDTKEQIAALNQEKVAVKQSAAQYYYKLRAVKMLGFVMNSLNSAMDNFGKTTLRVATKSLNAYLKLIPGVNALKKAISGTTAEQRKLTRETNKTTKANAGLDASFKGLLKNLLKYGLGIRSLFVLFNKLRKAVIDGLGSMSKQIADVNADMSSIVTSLNQMKASVTAAIQPLLSVLAPALERVAAAVAEIAYQVASFIAALTGQSVVYKASRVWTDYAASLDKTGKSAKKAKKELAGFDELNVLHTKDDGGGGADGGMGWDPVELSQKAKDFADKVKEIFQRLFAPIKAAWDKIKNYIIKAWTYAATQLKLLSQDMARDFWRVWEEQDTQKIFEQMFLIIGDLGLIIGNLAKNFRIAWNEAENGYRILASIRDIVLIIVSGIRECTKYTVDWSRELSFIPLLTSLADNMQQKLVPAVQQVVDLFVILYEQVLLKIIKDFIEKGLPQLINIIGNLVGAIGNIAENIRIALQSGSNGIMIVTKFEELLQIVADVIEDCSKKTEEWAKNLDFRPLLKATKQFLEDAKPLVEALSTALSNLWNNTLLPFYKYLVEKGFPKLLDALGEITGGDWSGFAENAKALTEALEPFFELAWETLVQILKDVGLALKDFLNSDELGNMIDKFKDWVKNANPEELAKTIEHLAEAFIGIKAAVALTAKVIVPLITGFMTIQNVFNQMGMVSKIGKISTDIAKLAGTATTTETALGGLGTAISSLAGPILIVVGVIALMVAAFGGVENTLAEIKERIDRVAENVKQFAEAIHLGDTIDNLKSKFDGLGESLQSLRPIFELLLDVIGGLATVIINTALGAFNGLMIAFGGVIDFISGIIDIIGGFIAFLTGDTVTAMDLWTQSIDKIFGGLIEFVGGIIVGIAEAIAGIFSLIPGWNATLKKFIDGIIGFFKDLKYKLIGDPIVYDLRDGIVNAFKQFITQTVAAVVSWVSNLIKDFQNLLSRVKSIFTSNALYQSGVQFITGLRNGISNMISNVLSTVSNFIINLRNRFSSNLSSNTLYATGYNLLVGLINGIVEGLNKAYDKIKDGCENIVNAAKSVFKIGSPSKVFEQIGEWNMEGLTNGIDEGASDTEKTMANAMTDLIPDVTPSDSFANNFLDTLTSMKTDAIDIINSMVDEMSASMDGLNNLFNLGNVDIATQMSKLNAMPVPNIAQGKTLPSTAQFVQPSSTEPDYTALTNALSSAIVDAITTTSYNRTDSGDTVIQIDGREVFRAVKTQNQLYQKSTGRSAF